GVFIAYSVSYAVNTNKAEREGEEKTIYVWTVNDMESLQGYYKLNVDGIITDYPEDARETIKMLKEQE
ncbi:glycerophosphodiester phosphodiesterase family protein, partial [Bacillus sp. D-CC]